MNDHYFSAHPASTSQLRDITVELGGEARRLVTAGGVFSPEHLDRGTEVLLRTIARLPSPESPVLDLGCGWGPIALSAAMADGSLDVWAVDINARARELTAENAARLGLGRLRVAAPDEVPADLQFGAIHSNPPIRIGKQQLHEMLRRWLPRLAPGGSAYLVVAKHLGADSLQRWIASEFQELEVSRVARDKGFHVIAAHQQGDPAPSAKGEV